MIRYISVVLIAACLLALSACRQTAVTPMLEITSQDNEEGVVLIDVTIDNAGWLVLHPATAEGEPDTSEALTKMYFRSSGSLTGTEREMPEAVGEDSTYFVRLYYDDPADGKFTFTAGGNADPPVEVEGEVVQDSFTVPGDPPYVEIQQNVSGSSINIKLHIYQASWLVLRPATPEGEPDTSRTLHIFGFPNAGGYEFNKPITGTLADLADGDTLFAVLHYDDPEDDEFTYTPGGYYDLPVEVNGIVVLDSIEMSN
ncbi:MAG: hypothetical protein JSV77_00805 [Dehalococcoidales bacterium]|nr:MAG: hypothetical protein JSV77_00805 [Dehalococcoidales bacterium]